MGGGGLRVVNPGGGVLMRPTNPMALWTSVPHARPQSQILT